MEIIEVLLHVKNTPDNFVAGQIKYCFSRWELLTNDIEILTTVRGLPIALKKEISPSKFVQHKFSSKENFFVESEINDLLRKRAISSCVHENGEVISPIFVRPKPDNKFRLILNLKNLNKYIEYIHFKMDTLSSILRLVRPNCFMAKLDIKDAYYSVSIRFLDQKLLKFNFNGILYKFNVLPNGYSEGPRVFTKLLKPPLAKLRNANICIAAYIDDLFTMNSEFNGCVSNVKEITSLLDHLGFTIHPEKSIFTPSQKIEFLGMIIDSVSMSVTLTEEKKLSIKQICKNLLSEQRVKIREVASILGKFSSSFIAVPHGRLHYRNLDGDKNVALIFHKGNFDKTWSLSERAKDDIKWWM